MIKTTRGDTGEVKEYDSIPALCMHVMNCSKSTDAQKQLVMRQHTLCSMIGILTESVTTGKMSEEQLLRIVKLTMPHVDKVEVVHESSTC